MNKRGSGLVCEECKEEKRPKGPLITDNSTGEVVCGACGLVLIERIESNEVQHFGSDEYFEKSRTGPGAKLLLSDRGLSTNIDFKNKDASGNSLAPELQSAFKRLRIWNTRSKSRWHEKSLKEAFLIFDMLKIRLGIPESVLEEASYLFRKILSENMTVGRTTAGLACASLYAACRKTDIPRTLSEIAKEANISRKELSRSYRLLAQRLDLRFKPFNSSEFISRIANKLDLGERTRRDALRILSVAEEEEISAGKNPLGLAATSLYLSCLSNGEHKSQIEVARASGITTITIRNIVSVFKKELGTESS